ncbi:YkoF family thiamine/hydroxymethylpyrimidine-binding protein [Salinimicrobium flavum]|uniref:YkoF family thiamine/hydroxymethylpyrimidine-binding protein n=1 Tax=Salinimicrobium flavum TaxID=1737065 RepID=A0ABW5IUQ1_9FLAO
MQISLELALTPLQDDFEAPIKEFIKKLRTSGFTVLENPLSTQIYGDYDKIMEFMTEEVKETFQALDHVILTMKLVKSNRSDYAADF